jgi:hypothetical protein
MAVIPIEFLAESSLGRSVFETLKEILSSFGDVEVHTTKRGSQPIAVVRWDERRGGASWIGHGDGGALLPRTCAHVMPSDAERGRAVLDAALGGRRDRVEAVGR